MITEAAFDEVVQPGLKKVLVNEFNAMADRSLVGALYNMDQSDKYDEDFLEIEDIGSVPEFTGDLSYTTARQGNKKTLTHTPYALGLRFQRELVDDDRYGVINEIVGQLGYAARYRMESDAASPFVNAFTSTYTVFDGLSLCNSAHAFLSTSTTQSNSGSTAFSYAALDAALIASRKWTGSQDRLILDTNMDMLLGPVDLDTQFREVIFSKLKPGTTNNNINVFNDSFTITTTPFLNDTNNWFLIDSRKMKKYLKWLQRTPVEFKNIGDFDSYTRKFAVYMRYVNSPIHWPFTYGSSVS